jgi:hypothetical protein
MFYSTTSSFIFILFTWVLEGETRRSDRARKPTAKAREYNENKDVLRQDRPSSSSTVKRPSSSRRSTASLASHDEKASVEESSNTLGADTLAISTSLNGKEVIDKPTEEGSEEDNITRLLLNLPKEVEADTGDPRGRSSKRKSEEQRGLVKAMKGKKGGRVPVAEPDVQRRSHEDHDSMQTREQCESG